MRVLAILFCLSVPAYCRHTYSYKNDYESPYSDSLQYKARHHQPNDYYSSDRTQRQQRLQQQLKDYGYKNAQEERTQILKRPRFVLNSPLPEHISNRLSQGDIDNIMQLIQSVSDQIYEETLRDGNPIDIRVEAADDAKNVGVELHGDIADKLQNLLSDKSLLRQNDIEPLSDIEQLNDQTLHEAGLSDVVFPGTGPAIELSIEGKLADMIKNMKMSQLMMPPQMKQQMLSDYYSKQPVPGR